MGSLDYKWVDIKELPEYAKSDHAIKPQIERYSEYLDKISSEAF